MVDGAEVGVCTEWEAKGRRAKRPKRVMEDQLRKRIGYEKMLAEISALAVHVESISRYLNQTMRILGTRMDVSRVYIYHCLDTSSVFEAVYEWNAQGVVTPQELDMQFVEIPWAAEQLKKGKVISLEDTETIPCEQDRRITRAERIKSILVVPLFIKGGFYGFMGFDECRHSRQWAEEDQYILTTAAQVVAKAMESKQREQELSKQTSRLEAIFRSVQDAIITVDEDGRVIEANRATECICGVPAHEIVGEVFIKSMDLCNKACSEVLLETARTREGIREYQAECIHRDRGRQTVVVSSCPLLDPTGFFSGVVITIRDITRARDLENQLADRYRFQGMLGKSRKMAEIYSVLEVLKDVNTTVLISGESGTGKEMAARALHFAGSRRSRPFVTVNCSALAENLLESELFGHVKGAFTGAIRDKTGRFEAAQQGTILLDEIGDISPRIQVKLLRVLQEKEVERVGETNPRKLDVRVIASTNQNLGEKIRKGLFRKDLYYRLKVMELNLPPLRDRSEDIPLLVNHFCAQLNSQFKRSIRGVSSEVLGVFMDYPWPGNVRELKHALERGFVLCDGAEIGTESIPLEIGEHRRQKPGSPRRRRTDDPQEVLKALEQAGWNRAKAARFLGISRPTLYRKIHEYGISSPERYLR